MKIINNINQKQFYILHSAALSFATFAYSFTAIAIVHIETPCKKLHEK